MIHLGLIGYPLGHSFSARFFAEKFAKEGIDAQYTPYAFPSLSETLHNTQVAALDGFNVTYPYKEAIIPYIDDLDATARAIGAVNVVKRIGNRRIGYNTDCIGFANDLRKWLHTEALPSPTRALVLGTGGAAKAVIYGLQRMGIAVRVVSRNTHAKGALFTSHTPLLSYSDLNEDIIRSYTLIINCTPLGMTPDSGTCPPIPYAALGSSHMLYDCVYNPAETLFLHKGRMQGTHTRNGLGMLLGQAEAAWEIWSNAER